MHASASALTLGGGWTNCWTDTNELGEESLALFTTYTDALQALTEHLGEQLDAYSKGLMESKYNINEFRIMEVNE